MELAGNSANRWEQVSNKIGDIAFETDKQREQLEKLITELVDLAGRIRFNQEALTKLSGVAYKEVFREESKMLNDDSSESVAATAELPTELEDTKLKQNSHPATKKQSTQKETATNQPHKIAKKIDRIAATEKEQLPLLSKDEQHHE